MGLTYTDVHNIRDLDFDGNDPGPEHATPNEIAIHGEIYRSRPEVNAVVHAHPHYALMCGVTNLEYRPLFGGFEPAALEIILKGVPIYPRAATITDPQMAADMLNCMGERDVILMKGHGITVTAGSIEEATIQAIRFDRLSRIMWEVTTSGLKADDICQEDIDRYNPDKRNKKREKPGWKTKLPNGKLFAWNYYVRELQRAGIGLPDDTETEKNL